MCDAEDADSLTDLWNKDIGKGSGIVTLSILIFTLGAALTYSICLGDAFSSLAQTMGLQVCTAYVSVISPRFSFKRVEPVYCLCV